MSTAPLFLSVALLCLAEPASPRYVLKIVHVNDMHAHVSGIGRFFEACDGGPECYGGFPRVFETAKRILDKDPEHSLFLNGGDNFQGSAYYTFFKSQVILDMMNPMGFDAVALGNHEFDDGVTELKKFLQNINSTVVCGNLNLTKETSLLNGTRLTNWTMIEKAGVKIGIVGYVTTETRFTSKPENVRFLDDVESVRNWSREAKSHGAQIVIALGHSGYVIDKEIARQIEEVDIVVGAHSHTFLYTGTPPDPEDVSKGPYPTIVTQESGKIVPVVQAFKYTKYLGNFYVEFDDDFRVVEAKGDPILLSPELPEDPNLKSIMAKWATELSKHVPLNDVLAYIEKSARLDDCRFTECEIGNLVTDAVVEIGCDDYPACIGLINGGSIRSGIKQGNLTSIELLDVMPFGNNLVVSQMDGAYLLEMLEQSVGWYDVSRLWPKGGFLQMSGLKVVYDPSRPAGSRVVSAHARTANPDKYEPVERGKPFNIVTTTFVYNGGDNFTVFQEHNIPRMEYNMTDYTAVVTHLRRFRRYTPYLDGRIQIVGSEGQNSPGGAASSVPLHLHSFILIMVIPQLVKAVRT